MDVRGIRRPDFAPYYLGGAIERSFLSKQASVLDLAAASLFVRQEGALVADRMLSDLNSWHTSVRVHLPRALPVTCRQ